MKNNNSSDILNRMNNAVDKIESVETDDNVINSEMRKVIIKRAKQVFNYKNSTATDFINYVDEIANQLQTLQTA